MTKSAVNSQFPNTTKDTPMKTRSIERETDRQRQRQRDRDEGHTQLSTPRRPEALKDRGENSMH